MNYKQAMILFFISNKLICYSLHIINDTDYAWKAKFEVDAHRTDSAYEVIGANIEDSNYEDKTGKHGMSRINITIKPFSIVDITNQVASEPGRSSPFTWKYAEATNKWGTKIDFLKKKNHATSLYCLIESKDKGNFRKRCWVKASKNRRTWDNYKKEHEQEMNRKRH